MNIKAAALAVLGLGLLYVVVSRKKATARAGVQSAAQASQTERQDVINPPDVFVGPTEYWT